MTRVDERIEKLLSDRTGAPWEVPPVSLRERTLEALEETGPRPVFAYKRVWIPLAAAACAVLATGSVLMFRGEGKGTEVASEVQLDPARFLAPALSRLTSSAENSFSTEAKELLEDTKGLTRRVLAQLPFSGAR